MKVANARNASVAPRFRGFIRFVELSFSYDGETPALRDISIELAAGSSLALVGPPGSGKSTLLGLLLRLHDPNRGRIQIDGIDIRSYTLASLRAQVGLVLPDTILFDGSVSDNIALGKERAEAQDIETAVRQLGCEDFIRSLPDGYETHVGERGVTLSAGQRQLVALCRMAIRDVPILLLDEPTAGLDAEWTATVDAAMTRLARGRSTLLVTRDPIRAAQANHIVRLEAGKVAWTEASSVGS